VSYPAEIVVKALRHRKAAPLPRGELFVGADFLDRYFPQLSGNYPGQLEAAARRLGLAAIGVDLNADGFYSLLTTGGYRALEAYFAVGCINGPFSRLIEAEGFVGAMISTRRKPGLFINLAGQQLGEMERSVRLARENGLRAIALADDIAGKNGLLFSPAYFSRTILPVYRDMAAMIKAQGLFAFLHSDGDMRNVIDPLIDAGFDCIHPVDEQGGLDLYALKREFEGRVSFMGHIDLMAWDKGRIMREVDAAEKAFGADGGLVLGSAGGISLRVSEDALSALYPPGPEGELRA
jgi:hypothetical protein